MQGSTKLTPERIGWNPQTKYIQLNKQTRQIHPRYIINFYQITEKLIESKMQLR